MRRFALLALALGPGCLAPAARAAPTVGPIPAAMVSNRQDVGPPIVVPVGDNEAVGAATARAISLGDVVSMAWENSAEVLAAKAQLEVAAARAKRVGQDGLPTADVNVGLRYFAGRQQANFGATGDARYPRFDPSVALRYRVNPAAAARRHDAAKRDRDVAVADIVEARRLATRAAALAYHDLLMARATMDVVTALVSDGERFLQIAEARAQSGVASEADVALASAELAAARQSGVEAKGQWLAVSAELATLLRLPTSVTLVPAAQSVRPQQWLSAPPSTLAAEASRVRPDLEVARRRIDADQQRQKARRLDIVAPELLVEARGYLLSDFSTFGPGSVLTALVGWSFAFGEFGAAREAAARTEASKVDLKLAQRRAEGEVHVAAARAEASRESIGHARTGLAAAERHQRIELARFEAGAVLGLHVIQAQNNVARARLGLAQAVIRYNAEQVELLAAVGHLDPTTVPLNVTEPVRRSAATAEDPRKKP